MVSSPQNWHQMLVEQSLLTLYMWEDICDFDNGLSMVNVAVVENLHVGALRSYPFHTFTFLVVFFPHSYHSPTIPSTQSTQQTH
jgi:hypothetical protein